MFDQSIYDEEIVDAEVVDSSSNAEVNESSCQSSCNPNINECMSGQSVVSSATCSKCNGYHSGDSGVCDSYLENACGYKDRYASLTVADEISFVANVNITVS